MSISLHTPRDHNIQKSVQDELDWTPDVDASAIGVAVEAGAVTLSGLVSDLRERRAARRAATRVLGVTAVADHLQLHPRAPGPVGDAEIVAEIQRALLWNTNIPTSVRAVVADGVVTLHGEVRWNFERRAAKRLVERLRGVASVDNRITLVDRPSADETSSRILQAFVRNAHLDARSVDVAVDGNRVTLTGEVRSLAEKRQARLSAWASPHVTEVEDLVTVRG